MHRYPGEVPEARIKGGIERGCKMARSKIEQETIINFNEAEETADIYTYNANLKRRLAKLAQERPEEVQALEVTAYGVQYKVPKKWVRVKPGPRFSDEQKQAATKRLKK